MSNPPEEWCFRSESARLLGLSVAQIHTGLTDGDKSVETLTTSFRELVDFCLRVQELTQKPMDDPEQRLEIGKLATSMHDQINAAIMAFQFYDRLCQRLDHVSGSLLCLSDLVKDEESLNDPRGWASLRERIQDSYTMEAERLMFRAIM